MEATNQVEIPNAHSPPAYVQELENAQPGSMLSVILTTTFMSRDRRPPGFILGEDPALFSSATVSLPQASGILRNLAGTVWTDHNLGDGTLTEIDGELSINGKLGEYHGFNLSSSAFAGTWHYPNGLLPGTDFAIGVNFRLDYQRTSLSAGVTHLFPNANSDSGEVYRMSLQQQIPVYKFGPETELNLNLGVSTALRSDYYHSQNGIGYVQPEFGSGLRHKNLFFYAFVARQLEIDGADSLTYGGLRFEFHVK